MSCNLFQYAAKIIHGNVREENEVHSVFPGHYYTNVNVHNPWRHKVTYAVKIAISGEWGKPGSVSLFKILQLGPDEVVYFGQDAFKSILNTSNLPPFLEAYLVIECCVELDIVGVYTGGSIRDNINNRTFYMERVPARKLPVCTEKELDISTGIADWNLTSVPNSSLLAVGKAPICNPKINNWATPPRAVVYWCGTKDLTKSGDYTYELHFNLNWEIQNAGIFGKLWADNSAKVYINNTLVHTTNADAFTGSGENLQITSHFIQGENILKVIVTNNGNTPTGLMIDGKLIKCC